MPKDEPLCTSQSKRDPEGCADIPMPTKKTLNSKNSHSVFPYMCTSLSISKGMRKQVYLKTKVHNEA